MSTKRWFGPGGGRFRGGLASLAAAGLVTGVTACAGADDRQAAGVASDEDIPELVWAVNTAPRSLDIGRGNDQVSQLVMRPAFDLLLTLDERGRVLPSLAESWEQPDPLTYHFTIRDDPRFWDGSPVTTEDVVYSLNRQLADDAASEVAGYFTEVDSVSATDDSTVTVRLHQPNPLFLERAATKWFVQSKSYLEEHGDDVGTSAAPGMGSGPYQVEEFSTAHGVTFVRNEEYWGDKPRAERLRFEVIQDDGTRRLAMQSGEIHGTAAVPLGEVAAWENLAGVDLHFASGLSSYFVSFDLTSEPWDDIHVRRAVAHAIDREGLLEPVFRGHGSVASAIVPPVQLRSLLSEAEAAQLYEPLAAYQYDLEQARAELTQSNYPDGFEMTLPYNSEEAWARLVVQSLTENLAQIGITVEPEALTYQQWLSQIYDGGELGMQLARANAAVTDPSEFVELFLAEANAEGGFNLARYSNTDVEDRLRQLDEVSEPQPRAAVVAQILEIVDEELPYFPLFNEDTSLALNSDFVYDAEFTAFSEWYFWRHIAAAA